MSEFLEKYHLLSEEKQQEVNDFVEFLYLKENSETEQNNFEWEKFKIKLLNISVWEEDSIRKIEQAGKGLNLQVESW